MEILEYSGKKYRIMTKVAHSSIEDSRDLKKWYDADLVLSDRNGFYYVLENIIDVEFEEINQED